MRQVVLVTIALTLTACGAAPRCSTPNAQGIVEASRPKELLRSMLTLTVQRTQTAKMIINRDGSAGSTALSKAVNEAVERHRQEWEQNLLAGWSTLSSVEIQQACTALSSRDQATYMRLAARVGRNVQARNGPVLKRAGTEVLAAVF